MIAFILEFVQRMGKDHPKFFMKLQWFFAISGVFSYSVAYILNEYKIAPILAGILFHYTTAAISLCIGFRLPNQDPPKNINNNEQSTTSITDN